MAASVKGASAQAKGANEDMIRRVEALKKEVERLSGELKGPGKQTSSGARKAAASGMEALKAQGEAALEALRENRGELEAEIAKQVREKPFTSLAIAAGAGFVLALLARR